MMLIQQASTHCLSLELFPDGSAHGQPGSLVEWFLKRRVLAGQCGWPHADGLPQYDSPVAVYFTDRPTGQAAGAGL